MNLGFTLFNILLAPLLAYGLGIFYYGIYRTLSARVHRRIGPPIWQNFLDNIKLFAKREVASFGPLFYAGPIIMAAGSLATITYIPMLVNSSWLQGFSSQGNIILLTYLMVMGPLGNALAVGVSGNPFGVMGVTRGLTRLLGLEVPFYLSLMLLALNEGSLEITALAQSQIEAGTWNLLRYPLIFLISLPSFLGFMGASPFDVVGAPVEVYSGPRAEFSGKYLGLLMTQNLIFSVGKLILWVQLFFGGATNLLELFYKTLMMFLIYFAIGASFPRFKTEQAVNALWAYPTGLALVLILIHNLGGVLWS